MNQLNADELFQLIEEPKCTIEEMRLLIPLIDVGE